MKVSGKVLGIDLGTTNSCAAVYEGSGVKVVVTSEGTNTIPSIVSFTKSGERIVGHAAKRQAIINSKNTFYSVKRLIGKKYTEAQKENQAHPLAYDTCTSKNGDAWVKTGDGKEISPSEVSAAILQKIVQDSEKFLGYPIKDVVITVPAYFNDAQRQATKDAGEIAGLNVLRIINEPTAAALAYGLDKQDKKEEKIIVYDLGGGTFDVSVLEISDGVIEVLSTNGNTHLGGDDFDNKLSAHIINEFKKESGIDISKDSTAMQRVKEASEKAKISLSSSMSTEINLPFISADSNGPKHLQMTITRSVFEQLIDDVVKLTLNACKNALTDAKLTVQDISKVLLVGGSTRVPKVLEVVKKLFVSSIISSEINPDEAVAVGAAIQGGILGGDVKDILLLDVTPLSLGIETLGGVHTVLIPRNTTIPTKKTKICSTAVDNQPSVTIRVFQGERELVEYNKLLGNFDLHGIPPGPRGTPQIEITFDIDANGILNVSAKELATGKSQNIIIQGSSGLSTEEVEKMKKEAEEFAEEDKKKLALIEAKNRSDNLIYTTEQSLKEHNEKLPEELKTSINEKMSNLKNLVNTEDVEALNKGCEELTMETSKIYEHIKQQEPQNPEASDTDNSNNPNPDEQSTNNN